MKLTIIGLPLGNIEDISRRALDTLQATEELICEDTRVFNRLWSKLYQLGWVSQKFPGQYHVLNDFNERDTADKLIAELQGKRVSLVSDAGMPLVSDPGYRLIDAALEANWELDCVPGPTAATTALVLSGLPPDMVVMAGFMPKKPGKRKEKLASLNQMAELGATVIVYESPYRIKKLLGWVKEAFGTGKVVIARELTKKHQQLIRGELDTVIKQLEQTSPKGEYVLLISKKA
jgi:16S rRNA (cytidine1402-2'-O)-methyltransferase